MIECVALWVVKTLLPIMQQKFIVRIDSLKFLHVGLQLGVSLQIIVKQTEGLAQMAFSNEGDDVEECFVLSHGGYCFFSQSRATSISD